MTYLELLDLDIDLTCSNEENYITEEIDLSDKTLPFIVPTYQPFYGQDFYIKGDETGVIQITNGYPKNDFKGFTLLGQDEEYNEIIGHPKGICTFGMLDQETLNENNSVIIKYRTVGARVLPLRYYKDSLKQIEENGKSVNWDMIFKKPDTFTPQNHIHSVTELNNWTEVIWWIKYYDGILKRVYSPNTFTLGEMVSNFDEIWNKLFNMRDHYNKVMVEHNEDYDCPHNITKESLGIGKVDNFPMATTTDDIGDYFVDTNIAYGMIKKFSEVDLIELDNNNKKYLHTKQLPITYIYNNHKRETVTANNQIISLDIKMSVMGKIHTYVKQNINLSKTLNKALVTNDVVYLYMRAYKDGYFPVFSTNPLHTTNRLIFIREYVIGNAYSKSDVIGNTILDGLDMNPDDINSKQMKGRIIPKSTNNGSTIHLPNVTKYDPSHWVYNYENYEV